MLIKKKLLQIKKVAVNKKKLLQIKKVAANLTSRMTRQATWKLEPSIPLVLRRIKMANDRSEKQITEGYFHQEYQK